MTNKKLSLWKWPDGRAWAWTEGLTTASRRKKYQLFLDSINPLPHETILDVGVSPSFGRATNFLEMWYPFPENITALACGKSDPYQAFQKAYPKVNLVFGDGRNMDFPDKKFNIAFSNAVVEHVGDFEQQKKFVSEMLRVAKRIFITTPNYHFPVDSHTLMPLVHLFPSRVKNWIYRNTGRKAYANPQALNLLSRQKLLALFPERSSVVLYEQKLFGLTSVLIAVAHD